MQDADTREFGPESLAASYRKVISDIGKSLQGVPPRERRAVLNLVSTAYARTYIKSDEYLKALAAYPDGVSISGIARKLGVDKGQVNTWLNKALRLRLATRIKRGVYQVRRGD